MGVAAKASVEQGLEAALESALAHWLYHDEVWNRGNAAAKREIQQAMARVRHALVLFGGIVPRKATVQLRESLTEAEAALDGAEKAEAALFNRATVGAKLLLTEWLVTRGWRSFLNEAGQKKIAGSFKRFADIQLSRAAAELKSNFQQTQDDYSDRLTRLAREIDSIQLLSSAYAGVAEAGWKTGKRCAALSRTMTAASSNISVVRRWPRNHSGCIVENDNFRPETPIMALSSQLQQHWQTVVNRLPADFPLQTLSSQAQSVMTFSEFVEQNLVAQPQWLAELESAPPQADEWRHYGDWLAEQLQDVTDEAALMRELRQFRRRMMVRIAAQALLLVSEESSLQQLSAWRRP